jgi:hypothetical protein
MSTGDCEICGDNTEGTIVILPIKRIGGNLNTLACVPCAEKSGAYCKRHNHPHSGFSGGGTACRECLKEAAAQKIPACPFYGLHYSQMGEILIDSQGNQCALKFGAFSPCQMETSGQWPFWLACPMSLDPSYKKNVAAIQKCQVYKGDSPVSFADWQEDLYEQIFGPNWTRIIKIENHRK